MIIDHAHRLHMGVHDGRADEAKTPLVQVARDGTRGVGFRRNFGERTPLVEDGLVTDKGPVIGVEATEFLPQLQEGAGVVNGRADLETIADDAGVGKQACDIGIVKASNGFGVEIGKGAPIILSLPQNGDPRQARLRAFEDQKLE